MRYPSPTDIEEMSARGYERSTDACCAAYREHDEKHDWSRISAKQLDECNSSLSFFDAEGMRFHLPAYLIADLNVEYRFGMAFVLTQSSGQADQFVLLNPEQRAAIRRYLKFIVDEPEYAFDRDDIARALETHWLE